MIDVMEAISTLVTLGMADVKEKVKALWHDCEVVEITFRLTPKGEVIAKRIFEQLPPDVRGKLRKLRKYNEMSLEDLTIYVYAMYPEYKNYAKLDDIPAHLEVMEVK